MAWGGEPIGSLVSQPHARGAAVGRAGTHRDAVQPGRRGQEVLYWRWGRRVGAHLEEWASSRQRAAREWWEQARAGGRELQGRRGTRQRPRGAAREGRHWRGGEPELGGGGAFGGAGGSGRTSCCEVDRRKAKQAAGQNRPHNRTTGERGRDVRGGDSSKGRLRDGGLDGGATSGRAGRTAGDWDDGGTTLRTGDEAARLGPGLDLHAVECWAWAAETLARPVDGGLAME